MTKQKILLKNIDKNDTPKYLRIVNAIKESIDENSLVVGDTIPSINEFSKDYKISRDTVYKAYTFLKNQGFIKSTPNKGYYICDSRKRVLLLISTFKAYKEVLYHSFMENLPNNVIVDLQFHHYNIKNFKSMLDLDNGKYYKYIVMGFNHPEVEKSLSKIESNKLLLIDWKINSKSRENYLFQDFGKGFYNCLKEALDLFKKYKELHFLYPEFTFHPEESVICFKKFCKKNDFPFKVIKNSKEFLVERNVAYISVSDRMLYEFLGQTSFEGLELGKDVGILSYNDTPWKKFTYKGITVVSVDFREFGLKAAEFISSNQPMQTYLKTRLIIRESL
ncbi:GntR family transcriptional regulator [Tamlana fucoidanivorans]|uniref:GntR family transcriptional regulator n=1 Tax=Allotamlana fucoidanivorans TaxID=2583814 RepID=A0A5C4SE27_9FLAO|nr:GntR family transcriptional regulator [Tamlana fucoidanivorans]TNJ41245.1 GntR family transcriptional regulator [Tamlana fucoidanivorans]